MHPRLEPWLVSLVFALALFSSAVSSEAAGAAAAAERSPFEGLFTRAACDGPAGPFSTEIISLADGTCRFVQIRGDDRSDIFVSGGRVHQTTDTSARLAAAPAFLEQFVRGHEVHRLLCDAPERTERGEPLELSLHEEIGGGTVRIEFSDWRPVHGIDLPFQVDFIHGDNISRTVSRRYCPSASRPVRRCRRIPSLASNGSAISRRSLPCTSASSTRILKATCRASWATNRRWGRLRAGTLRYEVCAQLLPKAWARTWRQRTSSGTRTLSFRSSRYPPTVA